MPVVMDLVLISVPQRGYCFVILSVRSSIVAIVFNEDDEVTVIHSFIDVLGHFFDTFAPSMYD